ncbi:MAG: AMP-binding protein [Gammaproteobacteria bacterium]|nr:AMP-binding protein [Gammaproteobacteria bacterium]
MNDRLLESHVRGASEPPLIEKTIGCALADAARQYPDREAIVSVHQGIRISYRELDQQAEVLGAGLLSLGLEPGDRVGIWAPNCVEWTVVQFATAKAGLILVNINPACRLFELEYALTKVSCRALVLAESFKSSRYFDMIRELAPELDGSEPGRLDAARLPDLEMVIGFGGPLPAGFVDLAALPASATATELQRIDRFREALSPFDPINIQFTSGTTGLPKGATLTHYNILNNAYFVGEQIRLTPDDRMAIAVPLYHCFGMVMGNLGCLTHGSTMVYPSPVFDPAATLAAVQAERCTALYGVPTMFVAELAVPDFDDYDLSSLRTGIMAGAPCPIEVMRRVINDMHMSEVTIAYGMTETSPVSFQSSVDDPIERRVTTIGRVLPHVEVKITDEQGDTVPCGVTGELWTKGYSVMHGYWNDEEKTSECLVDGWIRTGDLATIDEAGYGNIVGRLKDMVIRGGENLFPREIEEFLYTHEDIEAVEVFGVPDERYGEELCAWIRRRKGSNLDEERVREFCKGRISHYKVPRYIRFVEQFPLTVTGKVQKFQMRDAMIAELGLVQAETA